ncbi:hypothetical protein GCM10012275_12960 [Longimycelium tulufanense]|uniref:Uncharacterized protein n=1 Tax=Longimycelium tulufanense TaxID=907463 RepID=A0A8J3CBJ2_9PSEU|nr:hypothetical protein GCM10012275_12960 [Longimycelium tulufanense]
MGAGCACHIPDRAMGRTRATGGRQHFQPDTILIHESGCAHIPGACGHLSESDIAPPTWGWIINPAAGLWGQISKELPAAATHGNTALKATRRCGSCMGTLG